MFSVLLFLYFETDVTIKGYGFWFKYIDDYNTKNSNTKSFEKKTMKILKKNLSNSLTKFII